MGPTKVLGGEQFLMREVPLYGRSQGLSLAGFLIYHAVFGPGSLPIIRHTIFITVFEISFRPNS